MAVTPHPRVLQCSLRTWERRARLVRGCQLLQHPDIFPLRSRCGPHQQGSSRELQTTFNGMLIVMNLYLYVEAKNRKQMSKQNKTKKHTHRNRDQRESRQRGRVGARGKGGGEHSQLYYGKFAWWQTTARISGVITL